MPTTKFKDCLNEFRRSLMLTREASSKVYDFEDVQGRYYNNKVLANLKKLKEEAKGFTLISDDFNTIQKLISTIGELENISMQNFEKEERAKKIDPLLNQIDRIITTIDFKHDIIRKKQSEKKIIDEYKVLNVPGEIKSELLHDVEEMNKCFDSGCFKAATILCGRIMETALLRLYYDKTGNDLLETAPGIGLGKVIAKLNERGIDLGPGVNEQIHLVNQVRINSVHAKKEVFNPSREQSQAIILFTKDILKKIFS